MAKTLQLRRGTTAENDAFTGAQGEVTVDTEKNTLRVHDGSTVGGKELATSGFVAEHLPLSGGTMSGGITLPNKLNALHGIDTSSFLGFSAGQNHMDGASLLLAGNNASNVAGMFMLRAHKTTGNDDYVELCGKPNNELTWHGQRVESVVDHTNGYVKYDSGLMLQWTRMVCQTGTVWNYPIKFVAAPCVFITPMYSDTYTSMYWASLYSIDLVNENGAVINIARGTSNGSLQIRTADAPFCCLFAIGRWY